ncbi:MAG: S41 family peptidase [Erysipelotrichaceae bacterium]
MDDNKIRIKLERHKWPDEIAAEKAIIRRRIFYVASCIICLIVGVLLARMPEKITASSNDNKKIEQITKIMNEQWYFGKDKEDINKYLEELEINGMINIKEDPHTQYINQKNSTEFKQTLAGTISGIGVQVTTIEDEFYVEKCYIGGGAYTAGILPGDQILSVNDIKVKGMKVEEITKIIQGDAGSNVNIKVLRKDKEINFEVKRSLFDYTAYGYVEGGIGILEINSFSVETNKEVQSYLEEFEKSNVKRIIIDIRANGGGYMNTTLEICSYFMGGNKVVLKQETKDGKITEYKTPSTNKKYDYDKIVILMDQNSASASEVFAAAMKQQIGSTLVGLNTYGKGTVQQTVEFDDGSIFKYTIAEWLTPNNEKINNKGIKPDVEVKLDPTFYIKQSKFTESYKVDSVGTPVANVQTMIKFLGYDIDRTDGYYSNKSEEAVKKYQTDNNLTANGVIDEKLFVNLSKDTQIYLNNNKTSADAQLVKALEVVKDGK